MAKWSKETTISKMIYNTNSITGYIAPTKIEGSIKKSNKESCQQELPSKLKKTTNLIKYLKALMVIFSSLLSLDVGEGYYEPVKSLIYSYEGKVLRIPSEKEVTILSSIARSTIS